MPRRSLLLQLGLALALATLAPPSLAGKSYTLPLNVVPSRYVISVQPDLEQSTFAGNEDITIDVKQETSEILLNSVDLEISDVRCQRPERGMQATNKVTVTKLPDDERVGFRFAPAITPGHYLLQLKFKGALKDDLRGFYRSSFKDAKGQKHWIATTQMEPTDARRMFPCFDEPALKSTFKISTTIDQNLVAISNSPIESELPDALTHKKIVTFEETPRMSTYLVTLIVGAFEATEPKESEGVPVRVWTIPGKTYMGAYAQDVALKLLTFYNAYFGQPYPARKLDLIAIPDFEAGAMENLGAITFREAALLIDLKSASTHSKHGISSIVAHEMAHMWFGDLVTMKWWDDLWLNEAFASWMSMKAVDHLRPDWHEWEDFASWRNSSMFSDSLAETRAIHIDVENPEQAHEMFDDITYGKGASVLRMLEMFVSEETFQKGVQQYIKEFAFKNASTADLWKAIGAASDKDINGMMNSWVMQPGFPLITVTKESNNNVVSVQQNRFLILGSPDKSRWQVPLGIRRVDEDKVVSKLITDANWSSREIASEGKPCLLNAGGYGYFRVHYPALWTAELGRSAPKLLSVTERFTLLADQWALLVAGIVPVDQYLTLTEQYKNETDPTVIGLLAAELQELNMRAPEKIRPQLQALIRNRLATAKTRLGWTASKDETDLTRVSRGLVLEAMGTIGADKKTIEEARQLFTKYVKDNSSVDVDSVDAMVHIVAYNGSAADFEQFIKLWHTAKTPDNEIRSLMALGHFRERALIDRVWNMCMKNEIRMQDQPRLINEMSHNLVARSMLWTYLRDNWTKVQQHFPDHMLPRICSSLSSLDSAGDSASLAQFFAAHKVPYGKRTVKEMLERVRINVAFRNRLQMPLANWLDRAHIQAKLN